MKKSGGLNADRKKIAVVISVVAVIAIAIGAYFADDFIGAKGLKTRAAGNKPAPLRNAK